MSPQAVVQLVVAIVLLLTSLLLSIGASVQGRTVKTWTPFIWSAILGVLLIPASVTDGFNGAHIPTTNEIRMGIAAVGGLLVLASLGASMLISWQNRPIKTWAPLIWGTIVGLILM
jgi:UDP-N-acetylmuramyl pentapeptide phosphotransferase/UDP-N-acetylglucosamine-1-phosphate transferase